MKEHIGKLILTTSEGVVFSKVNAKLPSQNASQIVRVFSKDELCLVLAANEKFFYVLFSDSSLGWISQASSIYSFKLVH